MSGVKKLPLLELEDPAALATLSSSAGYGYLPSAMNPIFKVGSPSSKLTIYLSSSKLTIHLSPDRAPRQHQETFCDSMTTGEWTGATLY